MQPSDHSNSGSISSAEQLYLANRESSVDDGQRSGSLLATPITSQAPTSSIFNSIHNNPTANSSCLNHNVSHSDVRSHQILHRQEQQLIYLQRPPPPSPLKNCERSNSSLL